MNKKLKAFTLIELIIVMAIMAIIMVAIMQMMKPIRATYVDSTLYETQRTVQSGVVKYISESLRYADEIGIYVPGTTSDVMDMGTLTIEENKSFPGGFATDSAEAAVLAFKKNTGIKDDTRIRVITIDNATNFNYGGRNYHGRLLVSRPVTTSTNDTKTTTIKHADDIGTSEGYARLALGSAYYGTHSYSINIIPEGSVKKIKGTVPDQYTLNPLGKFAKIDGVYTELDAEQLAIYTGDRYEKTAASFEKEMENFVGNGNIEIVVSSVTKSFIDNSGNVVEDADIEKKNRAGTYVATDGYVICRNAASALDARFVALKADPKDSTKKIAAGTVKNGVNAYIVYALPKY